TGTIAGGMLLFLVNVGLFATKAELNALKADLIQQVMQHTIRRDEVERALSKLESTLKEAVTTLRQELHDDLGELKTDLADLRKGLITIKASRVIRGGRSEPG
ncbi:MAG: hypothetical protein VKK59_00155, partial [Vampirovibrionales bacterium]|nr:hypothetical protein [Vampirovibrionales bacterium]